MRFVYLEAIKENMEIAKTIYGKNGEVMLRKGTKLKASFAKRLARFGYIGIYIQDELSKDIEIKDVIEEELRAETTFAVKNFFEVIESGNSKIQKNPKDIIDIKKMVENIINGVIDNGTAQVNIIDLKNYDDYTYYHSVNVAVLSLIIGHAMGFNTKKLLDLGTSALLHDIGKVFIESAIINKPARLTDEEFERVKHHSYEGFRYLKDDFNLSPKVYVPVLQHHENYDGTGYPLNLQKGEIHINAKIISVADVYDALTSDRPYKKALHPHEAIDFIMENEYKKFDPLIVKIISERFAPYPVGTFVKLSNDMMGMVIENFTNTCLRPKLRVIWEEGKPVAPHDINLRDDERFSSDRIVSVVRDI